jgi:type IV secretory pathway VirB10-like protein
VLPSFRLIAATFLCSFLIVFVSLRLAGTSRVAGETNGLASNPLQLQLTGADAAADMRRLDRNAPVLFDLRFAVGATSPSSVPSGLTLHAIDRAKRESGIDFPEQVAAAPAAKPEPLEPAIEVKREPKIEVAALPEPTAAAADAPPPPPGPSAAVAALESKADVESVGSTEPANVVKAANAKPVVAKRKAVKRKVMKRARAKQAAQTDPNAPVFNPFPNNP